MKPDKLGSLRPSLLARLLLTCLLPSQLSIDRCPGHEQAWKRQKGHLPDPGLWCVVRPDRHHTHTTPYLLAADTTPFTRHSRQRHDCLRLPVAATPTMSPTSHASPMLWLSFVPVGSNVPHFCVPGRRRRTPYRPSLSRRAPMTHPQLVSTIRSCVLVSQWHLVTGEGIAIACIDQRRLCKHNRKQDRRPV